MAEVENMTPQERRCYDESVKAYRDYYNIIASGERISREKGLAEGEAKGKAKLLGINTGSKGYAFPDIRIRGRTLFDWCYAVFSEYIIINSANLGPAVALHKLFIDILTNVIVI